MPGILVLARLVCKDSTARKAALSAFDAIIAYTTPHEPNVNQYVCALPVDDSLGTEIYMIEEYADQAASDAHMETQPVKDLIGLFGKGETLAAPPTVWTCQIAEKSVRGSSLAIGNEGPAIVLASRTGASGGFLGAASSVKGFSTGIVSDDKESQKVRAEFVFESWGAYEEFRRGSGGKGWEEETRIRPVNGFVGREGKSRL